MEGEREGRRSPAPITATPATADGVALADPVFRGESMAGDARVAMIWLVAIEDDGLEVTEQSPGGEGR